MVWNPPFAHDVGFLTLGPTLDPLDLPPFAWRPNKLDPPSKILHPLFEHAKDFHCMSFTGVPSLSGLSLLLQKHREGDSKSSRGHGPSGGGAWGAKVTLI